MIYGRLKTLPERGRFTLAVLHQGGKPQMTHTSRVLAQLKQAQESGDIPEETKQRVEQRIDHLEERQTKRQFIDWVHDTVPFEMVDFTRDGYQTLLVSVDDQEAHTIEVIEFMQQAGRAGYHVDPEGGDLLILEQEPVEAQG